MLTFLLPLTRLCYVETGLCSPPVKSESRVSFPRSSLKIGKIFAPIAAQVEKNFFFSSLPFLRVGINFEDPRESRFPFFDSHVAWMTSMSFFPPSTRSSFLEFPATAASFRVFHASFPLDFYGLLAFPLLPLQFAFCVSLISFFSFRQKFFFGRHLLAEGLCGAFLLKNTTLREILVFGTSPIFSDGRPCSSHVSFSLTYSFCRKPPLFVAQREDNVSLVIFFLIEFLRLFFLGSFGLLSLRFPRLYPLRVPPRWRLPPCKPFSPPRAKAQTVSSPSPLLIAHPPTRL